VTKPHCCQSQTRDGGQGRRPASWLRRGAEVAGWILPGATLALLPKCPACVAAYVALATGIGISLPTAAGVRGLLMGLCVAALAFAIARRLRGFMAQRAGQQAQH
jgi:hypothetical protein